MLDVFEERVEAFVAFVTPHAGHGGGGELDIAVGGGEAGPALVFGGLGATPVEAGEGGFVAGLEVLRLEVFAPARLGGSLREGVLEPGGDARPAPDDAVFGLAALEVLIALDGKVPAGEVSLAAAGGPVGVQAGRLFLGVERLGAGLEQLEETFLGVGECLLQPLAADDGQLDAGRLVAGDEARGLGVFVEDLPIGGDRLAKVPLGAGPIAPREPFTEVAVGFPNPAERVVRLSFFAF